MEKRNKIQIFFLIVDVSVILIALYLVYTGQFSVESLKRAILFLGIFSLYRFLGEFLGLPVLRSREFSLENIQKHHEELNANKKSKILKKKIEGFILFLIDYPKLKFLMDIIFIIIYYNPFNLHFVFLQWIWKKVYYFLVFINGSKDILFKRYFGIDATFWFVRSNKSSMTCWYILLSIFVFPFNRMLLYPSYIKAAILSKYWWQFYKFRFIGFMYSVFFFHQGIYEYIYNIPGFWKIVIVYTYFAVLLPLLNYIPFFVLKKPHSVLILYPSLHNIITFLPIRTVSHRFLDIFVYYCNKYYDNYIARRYYYCKNGCDYDFDFMNFIRRNTWTEKRAEHNFWFYQKSYTVNTLLFYSTLSNMWLQIVNFETHYQDGVKLYGKDFERSFCRHRERIFDHFRCAIWTYMDCSAKSRFTKENLIYWVERDPVFLMHRKEIDEKRVWEYYYGILQTNVRYPNVPNKIESINFYKDSFELIKFLNITDMDYIINYIGPRIEYDHYIMEMPFNLDHMEYHKEIFGRIYKVYDKAKEDYLKIYNENEKPKKLLSLIEVKKFNEKWGKEYLYPPHIRSDDQEYWWKRTHWIK